MDWKKLEDIIQKVNDGPPAQTPLLLYSVVNEEQRWEPSLKSESYNMNY